MIVSEAREVAAQFQTPQDGDPFAILASTGVITSNLFGAIKGELSIHSETAIRKDLDELRDWARRQYVSGWAVGQNRSGFLPDDPDSVQRFSEAEWSEAVNALVDLIREDECGCDCQCDDPVVCHACVYGADKSAFLVDRGGHPPMPTGLEGPACRREWSIRFQSECDPMPYAFWIQRTSGTAWDMFGEPGQ